MYFARFSPLFPILHSPTFRPTAENALLLLSIASVGCLFLGSPAAVSRGKKIWARVNKAILASVSLKVAYAPMLTLLQVGTITHPRH
jgi:hypothetical protein